MTMLTMKIHYCIKQTRNRTITSLLTISFETHTHSFLFLILNSLLPLEEEHIRRAVHTTKNTNDNNNADENNHSTNEIFNKTWVRSTDLKRELKMKML